MITYPAHIHKKILAELEDSTYREVAARHRINPNTLATWKKQLLNDHGRCRFRLW